MVASLEHFTEVIVMVWSKRVPHKHYSIPTYPCFKPVRVRGVGGGVRWGRGEEGWGLRGSGPLLTLI